MSHNLNTHQSSRARATGGSLRVADETEQPVRIYFTCPKCGAGWYSEKKAKFCCDIKTERY